MGGGCVGRGAAGRENVLVESTPRARNAARRSPIELRGGETAGRSSVVGLRSRRSALGVEKSSEGARSSRAR